MNYAEILTSWYLRLNGFFTLDNFVVHRSEDNQHRYDIDVMAVRPPHVFEAVGGQATDWDPFLVDQTRFDAFTAVICDVKSGEFDARLLFPADRLRAAVQRIGFLPSAEVPAVVEGLEANSRCDLPDGKCITKLFVANRKPVGNLTYLFRTIGDIRRFIEERIRRHSEEKFASRLFFPSELLQDLIDRVHQEAGDADA